jgi:N-acyl-D-aspartate/D-glutamate deacylase
MPAASLEGALDFGWRSFGDWLGRIEGRLALNAGFLVGHSTIRKLVMGEAWQEKPTPEQLQQMAEIVDESIQAGALGFSSSWGMAHRDHLGDPVPSRHAASEELVALASVLRRHPGTMLEFIPPGPAEWPSEVVDTMTAMTVEAQRPLNWNLLLVGFGAGAKANEARLAVSDRAAGRGGEIVALTMPMPLQLRINLLTTILYNSLPAWPQVLTLPFEDKLRALKDPHTRARLAAAVAERQQRQRSASLDFDRISVASVGSASLGPLKGRMVGDIARERGVSGLDAFLDIATEDNLRTSFETPPLGDDEESWRQRVVYWNDPRTLVGGSDAGAHLDMQWTFGCFTDFVGPTVRERRLLPLEAAVQKVTDAPAQLYRLTDRGRLATGYRADVVVFDPEKVGIGEVEMRNDLPSNEFRLFADALGIDHVLVNGVEIVDHGKVTGSTPGALIRPPMSSAQ